MFIFVIQKKHKAGTPIIEIPPAIRSRMLTYSNVVIESIHEYYGGGFFGFKVIRVDNKYYFACTQDREATDSVRYYFCYYLLKDI